TYHTNSVYNESYLSTYNVTYHNYVSTNISNRSYFWNNLASPLDSWLSTFNQTYQNYVANNISNMSYFLRGYYWANNPFFDVWKLDTNATTECGDGEYLDGSSACIHFNDTVIDINKITYYNATSVQAVIGTIDDGDVDDTKVFDGESLNVSEANAEPGLDLRINFTGVDDFNQLIIRYKTTPNKDHKVVIQLWDFVNDVWDDHDFYIETEFWDNPYIPIWDSTLHIGTGANAGEVWVRIYMEDRGKTIHTHFFDFFQLSLGTGTFASQEVDPLSWH
ncbi:unnamed protein product, partial [marine sediment metagenome]